ncbi:MAG: TonB family protein [Terriglobales bacterium]|jgi:TonB family protein
MSAAPALALEETSQRSSRRQPIKVALDLVALRSGVPENLPGRCTDISETGVGAVVSGELAAGQQVAVELRLPNFGVPVRARALVRHQSRLHCGLEFVGLTPEQREMIRYWVRLSAAESRAVTAAMQGGKSVAGSVEERAPIPAAKPRVAGRASRRVRIGRRGIYLLLAFMLTLAGLGWWQWQRSWNELEKRLPAGKLGLRVSPEIMEKRIVTKAEPVYPEAARSAGTAGLVVLDAVIAPDGSVTRLRPLAGPDLLVRSATAAVQSWRFEPYVASGKAVEVETTISVEFRLN